MPPVSVGRIVFYRALETEQELNNRADIAPAIVTRVWPNDVVNLKVFFDGGRIEWKTSIQPGSELGQWSWPPIVKETKKETPATAK